MESRKFLNPTSLSSLTLCVLLGACASQPPAGGASKETIDHLAQAQQKGTNVVDENGNKLICSSDAITGSHLRHTTSCLTQREIDDRGKVSGDGLNRMNRQQGGNPSLKETPFP